MQTREINVLVLAYLGDTIYENYIRRYLIEKGIPEESIRSNEANEIFKKDGVYIFGYNNCEVIIKNCTFDINLHLGRRILLGIFKIRTLINF